MITGFQASAQHPQPRHRRLKFESLEPRRMLAYGDSYRDLLNFGDVTPHVPFVVVTESEPNNSASDADPTGLTPVTDAAILIDGVMQFLQRDNYRIAARKGDIVAIFSNLPETFLRLQIDGTFPFEIPISSGDFFNQYFFTAPATSEYTFSVGGGGYASNYKLGLAIVPNKQVVAAFNSPPSVTIGSAVTVSDASYDPEEKVIEDTGITLGYNSIAQRQWSGGGGTGRTASYTFNSAGTHSITLIVTSNDGETASVTHDVVVGNANPTPTGKLSSLQFVGSAVPILPDPGTANRLFDPNRKDYEDTDEDGEEDQQHPVLYAAGSMPTVDVEFKVTNPTAGAYTVHGVGPDGFRFDGGATLDGDKLTAHLTSNFNKHFDPQIKKYEDFAIAWTISKDGGQPSEGGTSHNTLYVSAAVPVTEGARYETVVKEAVTRSQALGLSASSDTNAFVAAIFPYFSNPLGAHQKNTDGELLRYWGGGDATPSGLTTASLLQNSDGRCRAWGNLFVDMLAVNGVVLAGTDGMLELKKSRSFSDFFLGFAPQLLIGVYEPFPAIGTFVGTGDPEYPYWLDRQLPTGPPVSDIVRVSGLTGQNNSDVKNNLFVSHVVVQIGGRIYDPSYGFVSNTIQDWEDSALTGIATLPHRWNSISESRLGGGKWVREQVRGAADLDPDPLPISYIASSQNVAAATTASEALISSDVSPITTSVDAKPSDAYPNLLSGPFVTRAAINASSVSPRLRTARPYVTMWSNGELVDMALTELAKESRTLKGEDSVSVSRRRDAGRQRVDFSVIGAFEPNSVHTNVFGEWDGGRR